MFDVVAGLRARGAMLARSLEDFLTAQSAELRRATGLVSGALAEGRTVFTCGNGGSAAHAIHLEAELVGRYRAERGPLPCIYLGMSPSSSTAIANDYDAAEVFARPLHTLGAAGDLLLAFSTSGSSPNVLAALAVARERGIASVLVSGPNAPPDGADVVLRFPGSSTDAIQDGHDLILHALMDAVDAELASIESASSRRERR